MQGEAVGASPYRVEERQVMAPGCVDTLLGAALNSFPVGNVMQLMAANQENTSAHWRFRPFDLEMRLLLGFFFLAQITHFPICVFSRFLF